MGLLEQFVGRIIGRTQTPEKYKDIPGVLDYARGFLERKFPGSTPTPAPTAVPSSTPIPPTPTPMGQVPGFRTLNPPPQLSGYVLKMAQRYGVNPAILAAILQTESGFNPRAYNRSVNEGGVPSEDIGIAQINTLAHPGVTRQQAYDPEFSINLAAKILSQNMKSRDGLAQAIASYNVGGRVGSGGGRDERGLGPRGKAYLNKVVKNLDPQTLASLKLLSQY